jgi:phospholipid/cholesterol/gamma-HCH transport system substrate-binding protein
MGMLGSVQNATDRIATLAQAIEPGARGVPALVGDARTLMANANVALRDVGPALQEAKATLAGIDKLTREYVQRVDALDRVAKSAEQIGNATQGAAAAVGASASDVAPRMSALLEELVRNSRNLDRLLAELNEQPQGLVFGRPSGRAGPGEPGYAEPTKGK